MKEKLGREQQRHILYFLLVSYVFLLFLYVDSSTDKPENINRTQELTQIIYEIAEDSQEHPNVAIQEAMRDIQVIIQGGKLSWVECNRIALSVDVRTVAVAGKSYMAITDETEIVSSVGQRGGVDIKAEWIISRVMWDAWSGHRPEALWHELYHLRQICRLAASIDTNLSIADMNIQLSQLLKERRAEMEAEVIAIQAYWYLSTNDSDKDALLESKMFDNGFTIIDIWKYFFLTSDQKIWPGRDYFYPQHKELSDSTYDEIVSENGIPQLTTHKNWFEWIKAIEDVYVMPLIGE